MSNQKRFIPSAPLPRPQLKPAPPSQFFWPFAEEEERGETTGTGHLHWTITAFARSGDNGEMFDAVVIEVEATDEQAAVARAMTILERPFYRVSTVRESCSRLLDKE